MSDTYIVEDYTPLTDRPAFIYAINCADTYIKFGITNGSVERRIQELQTGSPYELVPVAVHLTEFSQELEKKIHELFLTVNERGEWFHWNLATQFFVWCNFKKIINTSMFNKHVLKHNPHELSTKLINAKFGNITDYFDSPYKKDFNEYKKKRLSISEVQDIILKVELGGF